MVFSEEDSPPTEFYCDDETPLFAALAAKALQLLGNFSKGPIFPTPY